MAYSPSPQISPTVASGSAPHISRLSATPPPQQMSKRDKRRNALSERLSDLTNQFTRNRDAHFRKQLQSLQIDMNLIMRADPYKERPLEDHPDEIAELISTTVGANILGGGHGGHRRAENDAAPYAGKWYQKFVEEINDAQENRDAQLTLLEQNHQRTLAVLQQENRYKVRLAQEEHHQLSRTIRERLIQSIGHRKNRLMKEKEHLDIADSNALLLHPSQFSITNPASPGGAQSNRKTRHTRHRLEMDDLGTTILSADGSHKRKRRAPAEEENGSPGPGGRFVDPGVASPWKESQGKMTYHQMTAPAYSVDRLFTEKELAMNLNTAALATAHFFAAEKAQAKVSSVRGTATNGQNTDGEDAAGPTHEADADEDAAPTVAPEMDRNGNQSFHATRSTRNNNNNNNNGTSALNLLGDLAERSSALPTNLPIILPNTGNIKNGWAPVPPPLRNDDADDDLARIASLFDENSPAPPGYVDEKLVDTLCAPFASQAHRKLCNPPPTLAGSTVAVPSAVAAKMSAIPVVVGLGGVAMSAQSSVGGVSDGGGGGGVAMGRNENGSYVGVGGTTKRSASGAGFVNGEGGKRIRSR